MAGYDGSRSKKNRGNTQPTPLTRTSTSVNKFGGQSGKQETTAKNPALSRKHSGSYEKLGNNKAKV